MSENGKKVLKAGIIGIGVIISASCAYFTDNS